MLILWILLGLAVLVLITAYICFRMAFYADRKPVKDAPEYDLPPGKIYEPFWDVMRKWMEEVRALPYEEMTITSFDGLRLYGKYYECAPGNPIELMFHGYRGSAERDLCGGVQRAFSLNHNVLIVDQLASGKSQGHVISFGINESRDCLAWVDFACKHFGPDVRLILTGISMGASTVLIAAGEPLPENVIGVLADCGFSSAKKIIRKVIRQMGLPDGLAYPFVRLGALLFGGFDPEKRSALEAVQSCKVPVIFFHGETDDYVPCDMSREVFEACPTRKELVTMPNAGHGLCYPVDPAGYLSAMREFFGTYQ